MYSKKVFTLYGKHSEKCVSSLISLRKDNEVKLEDEIKKSVTSNKDRESIVNVVDCNFKATSK